jgi:hypothetical protein
VVERDEDSPIETLALTPSGEAIPERVVLDLGRGASLILSAVSGTVDYKLTEEIKSITPEMAAHQQALARIEADKEIRVAELTHVVPVKVMVRPLWIAVCVLGTVALYALHLGKDGLAAAAIAGMALSPIIDAIIKKVKKPGE